MHDLETISPGRNARASDSRRQIQERLVSFVRQGVTRTRAAKVSGIHRATFHRWMKEDATFATQVQRAEAECSAFIEARLYRSVTGPFADPKIMLKWLERRNRDEWGEKLIIDLSTLTDDQIIRLLNRAGREHRVSAEDYAAALDVGPDAENGHAKEDAQ